MTTESTGSREDNLPSESSTINDTVEAVPGSKKCTLCNKPRNVLVRCQIDDTNKWHFVCPGKCWNSVSGGEIDARGQKEQYPFYRYGGMWKNRQADGPLNAKKPKKAKAQKVQAKTEFHGVDHEHSDEDNSHEE